MIFELSAVFIHIDPEGRYTWKAEEALSLP